MAAPGEGGLRAARDILLICVAEGVIDFDEYFALLEVNKSREIYSYWKFDRFNFDNWDDARCRTELRFAKRDVLRFFEVLQIPYTRYTIQRSKCCGLEALCIFLKRLAYPCRFTDLSLAFGRNPSKLCLIFYWILDTISNMLDNT